MRHFDVHAKCHFKMLVIRHDFRTKVQILDDCSKNVMDPRPNSGVQPFYSPIKSLFLCFS